jgi:hypothetical protein
MALFNLSGPNPQMAGTDKKEKDIFAQLGSAFSSFGKAMNTPGFQDLLADIGIGISPQGSAGQRLGQAAKAGAQGAMQRQYQEQLAKGLFAPPPTRLSQDRIGQAFASAARGEEIGLARRGLDIRESLGQADIGLRASAAAGETAASAAEIERVRAQTDKLEAETARIEGLTGTAKPANVTSGIYRELGNLAFSEVWGLIPPEVQEEIRGMIPVTGAAGEEGPIDLGTAYKFLPEEFKSIFREVFARKIDSHIASSVEGIRDPGIGEEIQRGGYKWRRVGDSMLNLGEADYYGPYR